MNPQNYGPHLGKWVHQIPGVVTLVYDLRLMNPIPRYNYISKELNIWMENIGQGFMFSLFFSNNIV